MSAISPYNQSTNYLFNPTSVSSCCLWLDASYKNSLVYSGGKLSQWNDLSPQGFNAVQASGTNQPILNNAGPNGLTAINFGSSQYMTISSNLDFGSNEFFIFAAVKTPTSLSAGHLIIGKNAFQTTPQFRLGTDIYGDLEFNLFNSSGGNYISSNGSPSASRWVVLSCMAYRSGSTLYYNGIPQNTTTALAGTFAMPTVTAYLGGLSGSQQWLSDIGEIIIYSNNGVSTITRQQIEGYLAWKWGAQSQLPSSHPYYNNAYLSNSLVVPYFPSHLNPSISVNAPSYSGLILWLDAADPTTVIFNGGNNVSIWKDKSGLNNQSATYVNYPLYITNAFNGLNAMSLCNAQFSGSLYGSGGAIIQNTSLQVFAVASMSNTAQNFARLVSLGTPAGPDSNLNCNYYPLARYQSTNSLDIGISSPVYELNVPISYNSLFLAQSYTSTNTTAISVNGNTPSTFTRNFSTNFYIYRYGVGGQANANEPSYSLWRGYVCEVLIYSNYFNTAQRQSVEGYLANKWGLASSLPTNHPYYTVSVGSVSTTKAINQYVYSPKNINGLSLWLDAADLSTIRLSGSNVTQWYDKSGQTTTTVVSQPTLSGNYINSYQTLRFNNNSIRATLPSAVGTNDYALFAVWLTINGGTEVVLSIGSNGNNGALGYNGSYYNLFEWAQSESDFTAGKNMYAVQSGTRISAIKSCFVNGSNAPTASGALNLADSNIYIGNSGFAINGEICEILVMNQTISVSQKQQIEGYLAWKWNLQKSLPINHPFYLFPPG